MSLNLHYQELTCLPDEGISVGFLMGRVMNQIHLGLVNLTASQADCPVGLSFPQYRDRAQLRGQVRGQAREHSNADASNALIAGLPPIGGKIRCFSQDAETLDRFALHEVLSSMLDYVHLTSVRQLRRTNHGWAMYRRKQIKTSKDRLVRRRMKRHGMTEAEAAAALEGFDPRSCRLPYLDMKSHSTDQRFRLYVERVTDVNSFDSNWSFSTYGLSSQAAVPEF
tara:strand:+ start:12796 stop:13467 length:672 start_codon:yes stop_codon:yes gene_type:complete